MPDVSFEPEPAREISAARTADQLIASLGGDARAAVIQLVVLVGSLQCDDAMLASSASRGCGQSAQWRL